MSRQEVTQLRRQTRELTTELLGLADDINRELKELPPQKRADIALSNVVRPAHTGMDVLEPARKAPDFSDSRVRSKALKLASRAATRGGRTFGRGMLGKTDELKGALDAAHLRRK